MQNIPRVHLMDFLSEDKKTRKGFIKKLGDAFESIGFVAVTGHGISDDQIDQLYQQIQSFFGQPVKEKRKCEIPGLAGQRGYTAFGKEHAKQSDAPDLKEFFQFGQTIQGADILDYPPNVAVEAPSQFNDTMLQAYRSFELAGTILLQAIALHLGLDRHYFDTKVYNGNSILRAIHYPPITEEPKNAIRAEQHEDINLITLLVGASADGLELLDKKGKWQPIKAGPGEIVINVGDMLQRLTNNKLRSTTHRVVNPPKKKWHTPRYSIPFFLHPRPEMDLTCLDSCLSKKGKAKYVPITAGEYLDERLREIGLKK